MTKSQNDKMTPKDLADLNVKIPKPIKQDVKALAAKQDKSLAQMVAELLASGVASQTAGAGH